MSATSQPSREGKRLRQLRLKAGKSQEELARRVGVTTHTIWRLENNPVFNPRLETLRSLADALGINVSHFLARTSIRDKKTARTNQPGQKSVTRQDDEPRPTAPGERGSAPLNSRQPEGVKI
jgi:transcriptional regulator with XRE-family HTH domain